MELANSLVEQIVTHFLKNSGPAAVRKKMEKALPSIAAGMAAKGMTPENATVELVVRDALFRLWKSVIGSGTLADLVRDLQDEKVIDRVKRSLEPSARPGLDELIRETVDAAIGLTF